MCILSPAPQAASHPEARRYIVPKPCRDRLRYDDPVASPASARIYMKVSEPFIISRKVGPAKRRAAGKRIAANIRRLQRIRSTRTAGQALAEARGERLAR